MESLSFLSLLWSFAARCMFVKYRDFEKPFSLMSDEYLLLELSRREKVYKLGKEIEKRWSFSLFFSSIVVLSSLSTIYPVVLYYYFVALNSICNEYTCCWKGSSYVTQWERCSTYEESKWKSRERKWHIYLRYQFQKKKKEKKMAYLLIHSMFDAFYWYIKSKEFNSFEFI